MSSFLNRYPTRQSLEFWQKQMLEDFCKHQALPPLTRETLFTLFSFCPIHGDDLLPDRVPIVYGTFMPSAEADRRDALHPYARAWFRGTCWEKEETHRSVDFCPSCRAIYEEEEKAAGRDPVVAVRRPGPPIQREENIWKVTCKTFARCRDNISDLIKNRTKK